MTAWIGSENFISILLIWVFDIVPPTLGNFIQHCYDQMGCPEVTCSSVWTVYRNLLSVLKLADNMPPMLLLDETEINEMSLLEGYSNLPFCEEPNGPCYILADDDEPDVPLHALVEQPGLVV